MSTNFEKHFVEPATEIETLEQLRDVLINKTKTEKLANRFRALFNLKSYAENWTTDPQTANRAVEYIGEGFVDEPSELLKHEVAYVMGQCKNLHACPLLRQCMLDPAQQTMVRHEAAEALGALGDQDSLDSLNRCLREDPDEAVRQTCELAIERIKWSKSGLSKEEILQQSLYSSIDPAPPLSLKEEMSVEDLQKMLNDQSLPIFKRYRAMFRLRDIGTNEACLALATAFDDPSALLKHEIAYVFGQIGNPVVVPALVEVLGRVHEAPMVRHEAAEALGSIATDDVLPILKEHLQDDVDVVRESAIVALDMYDYENSNDLEYVPN
ncbi:deoxyhypusine hydroxylase [Hanseniaspora vineae]